MCPYPCPTCSIPQKVVEPEKVIENVDTVNYRIIIKNLNLSVVWPHTFAVYVILAQNNLIYVVVI